MKRILCDQYGNLQGLEYKSLIQGERTLDRNGKYEIREVFGDAFINYWSYRRTAILHYNQTIFQMLLMIKTNFLLLVVFMGGTKVMLMLT